MVNLTVRILGIELLSIVVDHNERSPAVPTPASAPDRGDATAMPVGFAGFTTDVRWQPGGEP